MCVCERERADLSVTTLMPPEPQHVKVDNEKVFKINSEVQMLGSPEDKL